MVRNASPQSPRIQALALLYKKRRADGSCLRCGEQGHVKRECTAAPQPFEREGLRAANLFVFAAGRGRTITATVPRGDGTKVTVALDTCAGVSLVDLGMFKGELAGVQNARGLTVFGVSGEPLALAPPRCFAFVLADGSSAVHRVHAHPAPSQLPCSAAFLLGAGDLARLDVDVNYHLTAPPGSPLRRRANAAPLSPAPALAGISRRVVVHMMTNVQAHAPRDAMRAGRTGNS